MYNLYGCNGTGSASVEAALALSGAEYAIVPIDTSKGEHLSPDFTAINPRQQVPALALPDGSLMTEGSAMMQHIADAFPAAGLAPQPGTPERAQHDRWLVFMAVNIYEGELRKAYAERYTDNAEGVEGGRVVNPHEYQDAFGFVQTAEAAVARLKQAGKGDPEILAKIERELGAVEPAWPALVPPEQIATDASLLYGAAARIEIALLSAEW